MVHRRGFIEALSGKNAVGGTRIYENGRVVGRSLVCYPNRYDLFMIM